MLRRLYPNYRRAKGFSLVELMVVVGILGVLMAIALPAYDQYVIRAKRSGAKAALMEIVSRQDRYAAVNRAYLEAATTSAVETGLRMSIPDDVKGSYDFTIALKDVASGVDNGFLATATPISGTTQESDGELKINQYGLKWPPGKW